MAYKLSRKAEDDIVDIYLHGAERFGVAQAEAYATDLEKVFEFLSDTPEAARERTEISPPVRCHPHGAHMVIYIVESNVDVFILRIRHSREDWVSDPI